MDTYSRDITCPKCGAQGAQTRYVVQDKCALDAPHLHLRCTGCEFGVGWEDWAVWPMDVEAPVEVTPKKPVPVATLPV